MKLQLHAFAIILLMLTMLGYASARVPHAGGNVMIPGTWIPVSAAMEFEKMKPVDDGKALGYVMDGAWAAFGPLDFSDGLADRFEVKLASPRPSGTVTVHLDSPAGSTVSQIHISDTGGYDSFQVHQAHTEQLSGKHRLVLVFRGGDNLCNVKAFRFLKPGQKGTPDAIDANAEASTLDFETELETILAANREDIEKHRTTVITLRTPPGATVNVTQTRHAFEFGTAISRRGFVPNDRIGEADQEKYRQVIKANFNSVVHENAMKWYSNERKRDVLSFADADAMLAWAEENGLHTRGHAIYWGRDRLVQKWLKELDEDSLREEIRERTRDYMEHFKGRVSEHDVNNEMLHCHYYSKRLGKDIRQKMFEWCHENDPEATLYVNDYGIISGSDAGRYVKQIEGFLEAGMKVGGIGVQGHYGPRINGSQVKRTLDRLAQFGLPIKVTEFDANTRDEHTKAKVLATLYATAFAHPAVEGIYMWGFWERCHWRPKAALWNADWSETLAAKTYRELVFDRWWTDFEGRADAKGVCEVRVFFGEHEVTVNGQTRTITVEKGRTNY